MLNQDKSGNPGHTGPVDVCLGTAQKDSVHMCDVTEEQHCWLFTQSVYLQSQRYSFHVPT
jgi:hypothetical protein